ARSATIETVTVDPAREERWNAVEVGGQHDGGKRAGRRDDVAAFRVHGLLGHVKAKPAQLAREPPPGFALTAGCGVDVYQAARERYRIHASSSVRVSVRASPATTATPAPCRLSRPARREPRRRLREPPAVDPPMDE